MKLFMDTDILIKLSVHHLLDLTPPAFGCALKDAFVLPSARYQLNAKRYKQIYPLEVLQRVQRFAKIQPPVPGPGQQLSEVLASVEGIDAGEVILFGAACRHKDALVLTDDKKSLRALAFATSCENVCAMLESRVFTLNLVVLRILAHHGLETVQERIVLDVAGSNDVVAAFALESVAGIKNRLREDLVRLRSKTRGLLSEF